MQQQLLSRTHTASASSFAPKQARRTTSILASSPVSHASLPHSRCYQHGSAKQLRQQSFSAARLSQSKQCQAQAAVHAVHGRSNTSRLGYLSNSTPAFSKSVHVGADATSTSGTPSVSHAHDDDPVQKAVNSGMGFIVGDILAQRLTGEAFDAVRSLELGCTAPS